MKSEKEIKEYLDWNQGEKSKPYDSENTVLIQELEAILEAAGQLEKPHFEKEKVFEKVKSTIKKDSHSSSKTKTIQLYKWISGIAALLLLVFASTFLFNQQIEITSSQEILTHVLPDQSEVFLDRNATITYNKGFKDKRVLNLNGEAFFEVEKGSSFEVLTSLGSIKVLGTSFNVVARDDIFEVSCKTGKVEVKTTKNTIVLTPGSQVRLNDDKFIESQIEDINSIDAWTNSQPYFESAPLEIVINKLANHYDVEILLPQEYHHLTFSGTYVTDDFQKALKMVLLPMNIEYSVNSDKSVQF